MSSTPEFITIENNGENITIQKPGKGRPRKIDPDTLDLRDIESSDYIKDELPFKLKKKYIKKPQPNEYFREYYKKTNKWIMCQCCQQSINYHNRQRHYNTKNHKANEAKQAQTEALNLDI